ncbi:MAG: ribonuclease I [Candidatus Midichloriaceae bacterium]|jgi:ribonuclease I
MNRTIFAYILSLTIIFNLNAKSFERQQSGKFDYYVFAQAWYPTFCKSGPKGECENLTQYQKSSLSPHGLWPNNMKNNHPAFCTRSPGCESEGACGFIKNAEIVDELKGFMPESLINHEWKKHGTCSGFTQEVYFEKILELQNMYITPEFIKDNISACLRFDDIVEHLGGSEYVNIKCSKENGRQYLEQVYYSLDRDFVKMKKLYDYSNCDMSSEICIKLLQ